MSDVKEALEAAFDFLGGVDGASEIRDKLLRAMTAPTPSPAEALPSQTSGAEAGGEPDGWQHRFRSPSTGDMTDWRDGQRQFSPAVAERIGYEERPLYALAKPASEPAGGGVRDAAEALVADVAERTKAGMSWGVHGHPTISPKALYDLTRALSSPASSSPAEAGGDTRELSAVEKSFLDIVRSGDRAYFTLLTPERSAALIANAKAFLAARGISAPVAPAEAEALPAGVDVSRKLLLEWADDFDEASKKFERFEKCVLRTRAQECRDLAALSASAPAPEERAERNPAYDGPMGIFEGYGDEP